MPRQEGQLFPVLPNIGVHQFVPWKGGHRLFLLLRSEQSQIPAMIRGRLQDERGFRGQFPGISPACEVARMTRLYLATMLTVGVSGPALFGAGFLPPVFKSKTPDESKIHLLIETLKHDPDEAKRAGAAGELRSIDSSTHPEAMEALIEAAKNDKKPGVRAEAVSSLSRIRGGQDLVGPVLEEALANDGSMRVRLQARSALMGLYLSGYRPTSGRPATIKPEEEAIPPGTLEKVIEDPSRLEAKSPLPPDRVTPRSAPGKETNSSERFGFRVIPSWINRKEIAPSSPVSQSGDGKWWTPRIPQLPGFLGKPNKENKEAKEIEKGNDLRPTRVEKLDLESP